MKKYFNKYHMSRDIWVKENMNFDDDLIIVSKWNGSSLNSFLAKKECLLNFWQYVGYIIKEGRISSTDKFILNKINESDNNINFSTLCQETNIKDGELGKIIVTLNKKGYINIINDVNDERIFEITEKGLRQIKKSKKVNLNFIILFFLFIFLFFPKSNVNSYVQIEKQIDFISYYDMVQKRINYIKTQDFNYNLFIEYMKLKSIRNKNIVVSQAILESDWFRSDIFFENNNLFGMKQPRVRNTTAIGINRGHASYNHWTCSVDDYKLWYQYVTKDRTYDNYFQFLVAMGYAEDGYYIRKIKSIKRNYLNKNNILAYEN